ncbi:MAG: TIGR00725 family protein [Methanobacteriota archaeon]
MQIAVIGSGKARGKLYRMAEEIGKEIAKAGATLVCGGLGGVMEAGAKGAKKYDGITVGILPGFEKEEANEYIDIKVVTAMSHARNAIIARSADALIAVGGELGTLSEISLGLKVGKPVIVIKGSEIAELLKNLKVKNLHFAETAREAVETAIRNLYISTK